MLLYACFYLPCSPFPGTHRHFRQPEAVAGEDGVFYLLSTLHYYYWAFSALAPFMVRIFYLASHKIQFIFV